MLDPFGIQKNKSNGNQGTYKGSDDQSIRGYILGDFKIVDRQSSAATILALEEIPRTKRSCNGIFKRSEEENQIR